MRARRGLVPAVLLAFFLAACDGSDPTRAPADAVLSVMSPPPASAPVAEPLPEPVTIRLTRDDRPLVGVVVEWSTGEASGSVDPAENATDADGRAAALWTLAEASGTQTLLVTPRGLDPLPFTVDARAGPVTSIELLWEPGEEPRVVGSTTDEPVMIQVEDSWGNPVPSVPVEWMALPGSGEMAPTAATSDAEGRAGAYWTFGLRSRIHTARVTVDGALSLDIQVPTEIGVRRYTVQEIPVPAGATLHLRRLNSAGVAVGFLNWDDPWRYTAVVWDGTTLQEIDTPPGRNSLVVDINESGQLLLSVFEGDDGGSAYSETHRLYLRSNGTDGELLPPEEVRFHGPANRALLNDVGDVFVPEHAVIFDEGYIWVLFSNGSARRFRTAEAPVHVYGGSVTPIAMNGAGEVLLSRRGFVSEHADVIHAHTPDQSPRNFGSGYVFRSHDLNDAGVMAFQLGSSSARDGEYRVSLVHPEKGEILYLGEAILGRGAPSAALNNSNQAVVGGVGPAGDEPPGSPGSHRAFFWEEGRGLFRIVLEGTEGEIRNITSFADSGSFLAVLVSAGGSSSGPAIFTPVDP